MNNALRKTAIVITCFCFVPLATYVQVIVASIWIPVGTFNPLEKAKLMAKAQSNLSNGNLGPQSSNPDYISSVSSDSVRVNNFG